jgi:cell division protein FtsI (penicillin-binding protein 3)
VIAADRPAPQEPQKPQIRDFGSRLFLLHAILVGLSLIITYRLYDMQIARHDHYRQLAATGHWREEVIPARRGSLLDTNGQPLAVTVTYYSLHAVTQHIEDPANLARALAPLIGESVTRTEEKLRTKSVPPVLLKDGLSAADVESIRRLRVDALILRPEPMRTHPQGDLASQLIGVVGSDGSGLSGAEMGFNQLLAGTPGVLYAERDTGGELIALGGRDYVPPIDGVDVVLTIDRYVQRLAERELDAALLRHQSKSGTIIVMDPMSGAVLAAVSRPSFRLTAPDLFSPENVALFRLPAISDAYEPGSTFKAITVAAAIDAEVVRPDTRYFNNQAFAFAGGVVTNWVKRKPQEESVQEVLQRSSNIGTAWVATKLGDEAFYRYISAFGFGELTEIDLPGETPGLLTKPGQRGWHPFNLATNSFGQGMAVTPIQIVRGSAAAINGGILVKPHVLREVRRGDERQALVVPEGRRVVKPETAQVIRDLLVSVVEYDELGTRKSFVPGYRMGAKTGTAEIPGPTGYGKGTIASIVGFGPAEAPRFTILVKIDEPKDSPWGEDVAAPVFRTIAAQLMTYYAIPPSTSNATVRR